MDEIELRSIIYKDTSIASGIESTDAFSVDNYCAIIVPNQEKCILGSYTLWLILH